MASEYSYRAHYQRNWDSTNIDYYTTNIRVYGQEPDFCAPPHLNSNDEHWPGWLNQGDTVTEPVAAATPQYLWPVVKLEVAPN